MKRPRELDNDRNLENKHPKTTRFSGIDIIGPSSLKYISCILIVEPQDPPPSKWSAKQSSFKKNEEHSTGFEYKALVKVSSNEMEQDDHKIEQRQKQVNIGKNAPNYQNYVKMVPRNKRKPKDPQTPDVHAKVSTRAFRGMMAVWKRGLHQWDLDSTKYEHIVHDTKPPSAPPPVERTATISKRPSEPAVVSKPPPTRSIFDDFEGDDLM